MNYVMILINRTVVCGQTQFTLESASSFSSKGADSIRCTLPSTSPASPRAYLIRRPVAVRGSARILKLFRVRLREAAILCAAHASI
eukprot:3520531-Pleurochrysis_carterae.AAC.1